MKHDRLKKMNLNMFLIPFILLLLIFTTLSIFSIKQHVDQSYKNIEEYSITLSESYTRQVANSRLAEDIITDLIDEKMFALGELTLETNPYLEYQDLKDLAKRYRVNEINLYGQDGTIKNSTFDENIGWKPYEGHPVFNFINSDLQFLTESMRESAISGELNKYAYLKDDAGSIVQIGISAQQFHDFLDNFTINQLIGEFIETKFVDNIFFTDLDYNLVATANENYAGITFDDDHIHSHFTSDKLQIGRNFTNDDTLHVCSPVFYQGEKIGTLTVVWSSSIITSEILNIIVSSVFRFSLIGLIFLGMGIFAFRQRQESISLAFYDTTTGLPNSNYLKEYLESSRKEKRKSQTALLLLDIEKFKLLDQTYGIAHRDQIAKQIASFYRDHLEEKDMLFRIDIDKFLIVVQQYRDLAQIKKLADTILNDFNSPAVIIPKYEYLNLKIAIYEVKGNGLSLDRILQDLSLTIGSMEEENQSGIAVFHPDLRKTIDREEKIESALLSVISGENKDYLYMHYQPLYSLKTKQIVSLEALARLNLPCLGNIPPLEFIQIAEKRNLIYQLGNEILDRTLSILEAERPTYLQDIRIGINISASQLLRPEFVDTVTEMKKANPEKWENIVFEITESVLMDNFYLANRFIKEFRSLDILLALDDFGTGYSSLAELRNMNINIIKIDKTFINNIGKKENLITGDIIAMAHKLGLTVVAEGVETKEQLDYLIVSIASAESH